MLRSYIHRLHRSQALWRCLAYAPKYAWMEPIFGWKVAKSAQIVLPQVKASLVRYLDKATGGLEIRQAFRSHRVNPVSSSFEDSEWRV